MKPAAMLAVKTAVFLGCSLPLVWLVLRASGTVQTTLGANPIQEVLHTLGKTGLNLLWLTLAVTPARRLTGWVWLPRLRRMLGLFCFFYVSLHMLCYVGLDQRFAWDTLLVDVTERPYITLGVLALLLMTPLAVTSTNAMQRRLGRNWKKLHRLVYPVAALALVHFFWQTKADLFEPILYGAALCALLAFRIGGWMRRRQPLVISRSGSPHGVS